MGHINSFTMLSIDTAKQHFAKNLIRRPQGKDVVNLEEIVVSTIDEASKDEFKLQNIDVKIVWTL